MKIARPTVVPFPSRVPRTRLPAGWPAKAEAAAWRGPLGEYAAAIEPHTEADPHAILLSLLAAVGSIYGRNAFWKVGSDAHYGNLFAFVVGPTATARKGVSWKEAFALVDTIDPTWPTPVQGLSTGEGLINLVRDDTVETKTVRKKGEPERRVPVLEGVKDKRRLVVETEFGRPLRTMTRQGNTLMSVMQQAWDGSDLAVLTRKDPLHAKTPHISVIAHVTLAELKELFSRANDVPVWNGFANRWLWTCAFSPHDLPSPIDFSSSKDAALARAAVMRSVNWVTHSRSPRLFQRSAKAAKWWDEELYHDLKHNRTEDAFGAATNRAAPLVMRVAMLYAALDCTQQIKRSHLESALALWRYCEASARFVFSLYNPDRDAQLCRKLSTALQAAGEAGLTRGRIYKEVFQKNLPREKVDELLRRLHNDGLVRMQEERPTGDRGRSVERWWWL